MKRLICIILVFSVLFFGNVCYSASGETDIPSYTIEQLMALSVSKQAKVDIIKKNNVEIENYKERLTKQISIALTFD